MASRQKSHLSNVADPIFLTIVKDIPSHAIFTLDIDGKITSWNSGATRVSEWEEAEVLGKPFDVLYDAAHAKAGVPAKQLAYAKEHASFQEEARLTSKSGRTFLAEYSITAICENKIILGYVVVAKDTTQRKKDEIEQIDANGLLRKEIDRRKAIERALKESNEELDAFASAAGHDLQEPLRMVVSYLQLIERRYAEALDTDGKEFLAFAMDGAIRMKTLISDLVEYSRIETLGKPFKKIDANDVLKRALENLEVSIRESNATVTSDVLPELWSDEVQFGELLQNLISNAVKFGAGAKVPDLKIHIGVEEKKGEFVFSIADNGPGIEKKYFNTIFLIFKQLGNKSMVRGSGVGLAICKKIVKRHKGRIWVESEQGKGATFYFSIPQLKESHE
jgi:PAS domain S-box-containing protein